MTKTCSIISCSPMCFPWGFDEEDEGCAVLKLILIIRKNVTFLLISN